MSGPWIRMIFCFSSKKAKWSTSVSAPLSVMLVQLCQSPEPDCLAPAASASVDEFRVTLARLPCWKSSSDRDAQLLWREQNTCRAFPLGLRQQRLVGCQSAGPHWTWIFFQLFPSILALFFLKWPPFIFSSHLYHLDFNGCCFFFCCQLLPKVFISSVTLCGGCFVLFFIYIFNQGHLRCTVMHHHVSTPLRRNAQRFPTDRQAAVKTSQMWISDGHFLTRRFSWAGAKLEIGWSLKSSVLTIFGCAPFNSHELN